MFGSQKIQENNSSSHTQSKVSFCPTVAVHDEMYDRNTALSSSTPRTRGFSHRNKTQGMSPSSNKRHKGYARSPGKSNYWNSSHNRLSDASNNTATTKTVPIQAIPEKAVIFFDQSCLLDQQDFCRRLDWQYYVDNTDSQPGEYGWHESDFDDTTFPTEHRLNTSEDFRREMESLGQQPTARSYPRQYLANYGLRGGSQTKRLPLRQSLSCHLKLRQMMSEIKRDSYRHWLNNSHSNQTDQDKRTIDNNNNISLIICSAETAPKPRIAKYVKTNDKTLKKCYNSDDDTIRIVNSTNTYTH